MAVVEYRRYRALYGHRGGSGSNGGFLFLSLSIQVIGGSFYLRLRLFLSESQGLFPQLVLDQFRHLYNYYSVPQAIALLLKSIC